MSERLSAQKAIKASKACREQKATKVIKASKVCREQKAKRVTKAKTVLTVRTV